MIKNKVMRWVMFVLVVVGIGTYLLLKNSSRAQLDSLYLLNKNYANKIGLYDLYKTEHADVVMLGNSLTEWVDWNELLGRKNIANRGIASDVTGGYLHRMEYVYKLKPTICFVEGGINDIYADVPVDVVFENYVKIIEGLRTHNIIPIVQSTLFVSPKWHHALEKNKEVAALNTLLEEYSRKHGIEFINLNTRMSSNSLLHDELTHDGVHLTAAGYKIWGNEVDNVLKRHSL
jgi:lysophospholipase L1-like esterase